MAKSGHLLRFVRDSTGDETSHPCRHGPTPDRRMDATSCPESTDTESGTLTHQKYILHDRDAKFCSLFTATLSEGGLQLLKLPARSPNLNAFAERWVRSAKQECLSKLILFSEASLKRVLAEYLTYYHSERTIKVRKIFSCSLPRLSHVLRIHRLFASSVSAICLSTNCGSRKLRSD